MFILGQLISIEGHDSRIPLPWWHRSPLAFESNTHVTVALTEPVNDRPGDILISVVNPNKWPDCHNVQCYQRDAPGVIAKAFDLTAKANWNIALAETVTTEGGQHHAIELICEPKGDKPPKIAVLLKSLKDNGFYNVVSQPLKGPQPGVAWQRIGKVDGGWVTDDDGKGLGWKQAVMSQLRQLNKLDQFELMKLVVYADTEKRCLRIMFPRVGARNVQIRHADEKGALHALTSALQVAGFNVLTSLLKRGGVSRGDAVLIAICEPSSATAELNLSSTELETLIFNQIAKIAPSIRADVSISGARPAASALYLHRGDDVVARVPPKLATQVKLKRATRTKGEKFIFLAYRFLQNHPDKYVQEVRRVVQEAGCIIVSSPVSTRALETSFDDVSTSMWASDAAILVISRPKGSTHSAMSYNLAHEFGFFQGQGKPLLLLRENDESVQEDFDHFSNVKGIHAPKFDPEDAFEVSKTGSIEYIVKSWLRDRGLLIESLPLRQGFISPAHHVGEEEDYLGIA